MLSFGQNCFAAVNVKSTVNGCVVCLYAELQSLRLAADVFEWNRETYTVTDRIIKVCYDEGPKPTDIRIKCSGNKFYFSYNDIVEALSGSRQCGSSGSSRESADTMEDSFLGYVDLDRVLGTKKTLEYQMLKHWLLYKVIRALESNCKYPYHENLYFDHEIIRLGSVSNHDNDIEILFTKFAQAEEQPADNSTPRVYPLLSAGERYFYPLLAIAPNSISAQPIKEEAYRSLEPNAQRFVDELLSLVETEKVTEVSKDKSIYLLRETGRIYFKHATPRLMLWVVNNETGLKWVSIIDLGKNATSDPYDESSLDSWLEEGSGFVLADYLEKVYLESVSWEFQWSGYIVSQLDEENALSANHDLARRTDASIRVLEDRGTAEVILMEGLHCPVIPTDKDNVSQMAFELLFKAELTKKKLKQEEKRIACKLEVIGSDGGGGATYEQLPTFVTILKRIVSVDGDFSLGLLSDFLCLGAIVKVVERVSVKKVKIPKEAALVLLGFPSQMERTARELLDEIEAVGRAYRTGGLNEEDVLGQLAYLEELNIVSKTDEDETVWHLNERFTISPNWN